MVDIDTFSPRTGRLIRESGITANVADIAAKTALEIARGNETGSSNIFAYGEITTAGAVMDQLIWPLSGSGLAVPDEAGVQMAIVSSSADDTAAGTGIQQVEVIYLDGDLAQQAEIVTMNGVTPVNMIATDVRFVQCVHCARVGSGKKAAGNISVTNGGTTYSYIPTSKLRCSSSARRVPAGKRLIVSGVSVSAISGAGQARAECHFACSSIYSTDHAEEAIIFPFISAGAQDGGFSMPDQFFMAPAGSVVAMTVTIDKAATINGNWHGWFENV